MVITTYRYFEACNILRYCAGSFTFEVISLHIIKQSYPSRSEWDKLKNYQTDFNTVVTNRQIDSWGWFKCKVKFSVNWMKYNDDCCRSWKNHSDWKLYWRASRNNVLRNFKNKFYVSILLGAGCSFINNIETWHMLTLPSHSLTYSQHPWYLLLIITLYHNPCIHVIIYWFTEKHKRLIGLIVKPAS